MVENIVLQDDHSVTFVQYLTYAKKMIKLYTKEEQIMLLF